jgi:hypothetical protein
MTSYQQQLDLLQVRTPPCGRSSAPFCELEFRPAFSGGWLACLYCECIVPGRLTLPSSW